MKIAIVQPIFAPTAGQAERNIRSVASLANYLGQFSYKKIRLYFGGWGIETHFENVAKQIRFYHEMRNAALVKFGRNYGKAYIANRLINDIVIPSYDPDLLFMCDSDIVFDDNCEYMFERITEIAARSIQLLHKPFGLVALNQAEGNCHLPISRENHFSFVNSFGQTENLFFPTAPGGIAGGCWVCSADAWKKVGGYREMGVYAGDDAYLLRDVGEAGFSYQLSEEIYVIHPIDQDQDYAIWKRDVCLRDSDGSFKADISSQVNEAERFWLERTAPGGGVSSRDRQVPTGRHMIPTTRHTRYASVMPAMAEVPLALITHHGTAVCLDPTSGDVSHRSPGEIPDDWPLVCVTTGHFPKLLRCRRHGGASELGNVALLMTPIPDRAIVIEPITNFKQIALRIADTYVSAEPDGRLRPGIPHLKEWEKFTPIPLDSFEDIGFLCRHRWLCNGPQIPDLAPPILMDGPDQISHGEMTYKLLENLPLLDAERADIYDSASDPMNIILHRDGWKTDNLVLYRPLVVFVLFGGGDIVAQFRLAVLSLFRVGRYDGDILVIGDRSREDLQPLFPPEFRGELLVYRAGATDRLDQVGARMMLGEITAAKVRQPVLYTDADVIFDRPLAPFLHRLALLDKLSAQIETREPLAAKPSVGGQLVSADGMTLGEMPGFNAGILGIPNMYRHARTLRAIRRGMVNFVERLGREALVGADQAMANYITLKLNVFDGTLISGATRVPLNRLPPSPEEARGFVHFWPFGAERTAAMGQYLDTLIAKKLTGTEADDAMAHSRPKTSPVAWKNVG